jgi:hypothetical protein
MAALLRAPSGVEGVAAPFVVLLVLVRQHYLGSSGFGTTPCPERFGGPTRETGCHGVRNRSVG